MPPPPPSSLYETLNTVYLLIAHAHIRITPTGSTLLYVLDRFALGPYDPEQGELEGTGNIGEVQC